jgi:hypothetical protein
MPYRASGKWGIRIRNPRTIAKAIDPDVLAAFYKCFVGIDRLLSLEHLIYVSQLDYASRHGGRDTPSAERNMHMLVLLLAGGLYELADAIQELTSMKCVHLVSDRSIWHPINQFRKQWYKNAYAARIRNGYAHHLGEISTFRAGIDGSPDEVELICGDNPRRHGARYIEPVNALMRGDELDDMDFDSFVKKTQRSHDTLPDAVWTLFNEVLSVAGIVVDASEDGEAP